jgi:hypothetical protein
MNDLNGISRRSPPAQAPVCSSLIKRLAILPAVVSAGARTCSDQRVAVLNDSVILMHIGPGGVAELRDHAMCARIGRIAGLALVIPVAATAASAGQSPEGSNGAVSDAAGTQHEIAQAAEGAHENKPGLADDLREPPAAAFEINMRLDGAIGAIDTQVVLPD